MTRDRIIKLLAESLKSNSYVFAFWLEGADVHDRTDEFSDIDIWIDTEDQHDSKILDEIENILSRLAKIDFAHEVEHPNPKIRQKFFHLEGTSDFLIIDLCIQKHSRVFWYRDRFQDEKAKVIFDKKNVIQYKPVNQKKFDKKISEKIKNLEKTFLFFQVWVRKSIKRKNFLEALGNYHEKVLEPLVTLLRIKHQPTKHNFYLKDISYDIPKNILSELEDLYKVTSIHDIKTKIKKANKLFFETIDKIKNQQNTRQ
jgi:predicted nucleotidyltransferase